MKRAGYTLVEVMTAVVVMTIGATGIVALQGASVRANQDANEMSNAVNFATTWIERLKRDARRWNTFGTADLAATNNAWLNNVTTTTNWFVPATTAPEQAAADINGFDTPSEFTAAVGGAPLAHFCVNVRLAVVQGFNPSAPFVYSANDVSAIRTDVRVWWYRNAYDTDRRTTSCRARALNAQEVDDAGTSWRYRKTYLSNVVSWRAPGWP